MTVETKRERGRALATFTVSLINAVSKSKLGWDGFMWATHPRHSPSLRKAKAGSQGRNLETGDETEAVEGAAYWMVPMHFSACFYIPQRTTTHPTVDWALPHQPLMKTVSHRLTYGVI